MRRSTMLIESNDAMQQPVELMSIESDFCEC